ncbi:hypothetical protein Fmac_023962 [Flemingia macrophylla]|uniref:Uncharacterized protein n=1 Tax=Flemingia macrophylla TaxID=520843 RepID=A0ABD1LN26_9FABA
MHDASVLHVPVHFKTATMLGHLNSWHCISAVNTGILEDDSNIIIHWLRRRGSLSPDNLYWSKLIKREVY